MITHQLNIKAPLGLSGILNFVNRLQLSKFSMCWVPDREGRESLTGDLSVSDGLPVKYIGPLSRFQATLPAATGEVTKKYEIVAIVSGPEPQRKIFEELLRTQLKNWGRTALLVYGLPEVDERSAEGSLQEVSHLPSVELNRAILESEIVISRPGYSTIMDLARLGKKAIFIPTPGQTEQEYLGSSLMEKRIALCVRQHEFDLERALKQSLYYDGFGPFRQDRLFQKALDELLQ
jgi:UDP-N-acetylglucosamine transferase subunit ALG13